MKKSIFMLLIVLGLLSLGVYAECPSGIISYWTFDNAEAFKFTGNTNYVNIGDPANGSLDFGTRNFSITTWINIDDFVTRRFIFAKDTNPVTGGLYSLEVYFDAKIRTYLFSDYYNKRGTASNDTITVGSWYHVAMVVDRSDDVLIYINGIKQNQIAWFTAGTLADINLDSIHPFTIGRNLRIIDTSYHGLMDEMAVFNRTLGSSEIQELYAKGLYGRGYCESVEPAFSNFSSDPETTNLSALTNFTSVYNLKLAKSAIGNIMFPVNHAVNVLYQDFDSNVKIEPGFVSINTASLHPSFNSSATITLEGVGCPVMAITYAEGFYSTKDDIIANGSNCVIDGFCTNVTCLGSTLRFDVAHFTGFAVGSNANLTTEAEAGIKNPWESIEFYAWYINSTDGTPISGECNISFDDDWNTLYAMDFNGSGYNFTKESGFVTEGLHEYNVTCLNASFVTLEANDSKYIGIIIIPEFNIFTLALSMIAVLLVLFVIRKRR